MALWREGCLALAVAKGKTRGYRHHPQLARFTKCRNPTRLLQSYLLVVHAEAQARGYAFDRSKLGTARTRSRLTVTQGQLDYESAHLLRKLRHRDRARWSRHRGVTPVAHPLFKVLPGPVEAWERVG